MTKIVLAFDKFKGSATSLQVAEAALRAVRQACPGAQVVTLPVADGGEGTVQAFARAWPGAQWVSCTVSAPLPGLPPVTARYLVRGRTAVMELAAASGLLLVPPERRDVMHASTCGTGQMIAHALRGGCRHVVLGIGGSATCDCATGLLAALGFRFLDGAGREVPPCGANLGLIERVDASGVLPQARAARFTLVSDVANPLCGPQGAARVFGPQKGATPAQVQALDSGAARFARLMPADVPARAGAGAAGGVGAGLMAFLQATLVPGVEAVLQALDFDRQIAGATLVFTGEGRIDAQSGMGKATGGVCRAAHRQGIPVVALCGALDPAVQLSQLGFDAVFPIVAGPVTASQAMDTATTLAGVARTVAQVMGLLRALNG